ncbi:MAG: hypothetical protein K0R55_1236 [Sporomusa sp.]|jgi:hypothetical protein|nr:hypothetical protein [Sporomusa sp.]
MIGLINLNEKQTGERSAGNPHAGFGVAKAGNVTKADQTEVHRESVGIITGVNGMLASFRPYLREPEGEIPSGYLPPCPDYSIDF